MDKNKVGPLQEPSFDVPPPYSMPQGHPHVPPPQPPVGFLNSGQQQYNGMPQQQQHYPQQQQHYPQQQQHYPQPQQQQHYPQKQQHYPQQQQHYPQKQQHYPQQQQHYPQQPLVQVITMPNLGPGASRMTCPHCRAEITTSVRHQTSCMTHLVAGVLCLLGLWCCVCIPYCTDSCMDAEHECPNCNKFIGTFRR